MPDFFQRFALGFAILMLGAWGVALLFFPEWVHSMWSAEPINYTSTTMLGAALTGLAFISLVDITDWLSPSRSLGGAMTILVATSIYLMFVSGEMLITTLTSMTLVAAGAVAVFLFM